MPDMERSGFATASSAVVRSGLWQACTSPNFQGHCVQLAPGEYRNVNALLDEYKLTNRSGTQEVKFGDRVRISEDFPTTPAHGTPVCANAACDFGCDAGFERAGDACAPVYQIPPNDIGMIQLPPVMVSAPFKILLFVLVDGWNLVVGSLLKSFYT